MDRVHKYGCQNVFGRSGSSLFAEWEKQFKECNKIEEIFGNKDKKMQSGIASESTKIEEDKNCTFSESEEFEVHMHESLESPIVSESLGSVNQSGPSLNYEDFLDEPMEGYEVVAESSVSNFSKPLSSLQETEKSFEGYR